MDFLDFLKLLSVHAYSIPYYIILLSGIVYAVVNRQKHPRTSLFAGIALGIMLIENLLSAILSTYFQYQFVTNHPPVSEYGIKLTILNLCALPFSILGWILLLMAIFKRENVAEREVVNDHVDGNNLL